MTTQAAAPKDALTELAGWMKEEEAERVKRAPEYREWLSAARRLARESHTPANFYTHASGEPCPASPGNYDAIDHWVLPDGKLVFTRVCGHGSP